MATKKTDNSKGKEMMKKYGITSKDNIVTAGKKIQSLPKLSLKKGK